MLLRDFIVIDDISAPIVTITYQDIGNLRVKIISTWFGNWSMIVK